VYVAESGERERLEQLAADSSRPDHQHLRRLDGLLRGRGRGHGGARVGAAAGVLSEVGFGGGLEFGGRGRVVWGARETRAAGCVKRAKRRGN